MRKTKINRIWVMLLCIICLGMLFSCKSKETEQSNNPFAEDLWLSEVYLEGVVSENGDFLVNETWNVMTTSEEGYRNLYREVNTYDNSFNVASGFLFNGVVNNTTKTAYPIEENIKQMQINSAYEYNVTHYENSSYSIKVGETLYEIGIIIPKLCKGKNLSITFSYTLENFVGAYADTAEFYWKPFSADFSLPIQKLEIKITMPSKVNYENQEDSFVWYHSTNKGKIEFEKNIVSFSMQMVGQKTDIKIHSIMPVYSFSTLTKVSTIEKKDAIIEQERG